MNPKQNEFSMPNQDQDESTNVSHINGAVELENKDQIDGTEVQKPEDQITNNEEPIMDDKLVEPSKKKKGSVIKKTFISLAVLATLGTSIFFAQQSGLLESVIANFNAGKKEAKISEEDVRQNQQLGDLYLQLQDIKTNNETLNAETRIKVLEVDYQNLLSISSLANQTADTALKQANRNKDDLELRFTEQNIKIEKIIETASLNQETLLTTVYDQLQSDKSELLKSIKSTKKLSEKNQRHLQQIDRDLNQENVTNTTKVNNAKTTSQTPQRSSEQKPKVVVKEVTYFKGLQLRNVFKWSNKRIALLSDGLGGSLQLVKGQTIGDDTITRITDSFIEITNDDGTLLTILTKSNRG